MKRSLRCIVLVAALILLPLTSPAVENATVTEGSIPLMQAPSFIVEEVPGFSTAKGQRVEVLSRTSFTDYLAAVPEDYWYNVRVSRAGAPVTGYIHGSVLVIDPGATVPVFDPPGYAPKAPAPAAARHTIWASVDGNCRKAPGTLKVPVGKKARDFRVERFDSNFVSCHTEAVGSIIGFAIAPVKDPTNEYFTYEEHIASDPEEIEAARNKLGYLVLDPGTYLLDVRSGSETLLEISYELADEGSLHE